ncbi:MAG: pyridoxal-phosphate dependent enzyme, partial [Parvibaculaceae bacterium]
DPAVRGRAQAHFRKSRVRLPTFKELSQPDRIDPGTVKSLAALDPDAPDARNLFRIHWHNAADRRGQAAVPEHVVLPRALTGTDAKIIVALGDCFPLIGAHKVLAAYACLVPRIVTGQFDPQRQRAVWPSTGNYCRGGVAVSRILGCRSVAVLPEGMSVERFNWLEKWTADPGDIVRTPGSESNLKEIYDACHELAKDPQNVILNQFSEFGNYAVHRAVTGPALARIFSAVKGDTRLKARAFVCASGSGGTLAAGDHLKATFGTEIAAVEAVECPTLLRNGYGEHNIQGIGDKHVPLIHNVLNTDYVVGVSERTSDNLYVLFNTEEGRRFLRYRKEIPDSLIAGLGHFGLSAIANVAAAIKLARYLRLTADDAVLTVATDGAAMYRSQLDKTQGFDDLAAAEIFGEHLAGIGTGDMLELTRLERERIFNLGYYTWVEQQGVSLEAFDRRRDPAFWDGVMDLVPVWDGMIDAFNAETA